MTPLSTFHVSSIGGAAEGVFAELEVYFDKDRESVEAYLTTTDGQVPTQTIIPPKIVLNPILSSSSGYQPIGSFTNISKGTVVRGQTSSATGILKYNQVFDHQVATQQPTSTTPSMTLLSNYTGEFLPGETIVPKSSRKPVLP